MSHSRRKPPFLLSARILSRAKVTVPQTLALFLVSFPTLSPRKAMWKKYNQSFIDKAAMLGLGKFTSEAVARLW